jgi:hypothetical protein
MSTFVSPLNKGITCNMSQLVTRQTAKISIVIIQASTSISTTQIQTVIAETSTSMSTSAGVKT